MIRVDLTSDVPVQIKCKAGDTLLWDGIVFWSNTAKTIPLNISSDTFLMKVFDDAGLEVFNFDNEFTVYGTDNNYLKLTVSNTVMNVEPTPAGQPYSYYLQWTQTSTSKVTKIATGQFIIESKDKNG